MALALSTFLLGLPQEAQADASLKIRCALAREAASRKDILTWGQMLMPQKFNLPFNEMHRHIIKTRHTPTCSLKAPRGHSKSTISCSLLPLFQGLEEPNQPFSFYLNCQNTEEKALAINRSIKNEIEGNPAIRYLYGDVSGKRMTDAEFVLKSGVVFKAVGTGTSLRGVQYQNMRPDWVCLDDAYDESDIYSLETTRKKTSWILSTLYKALARGRPTRFTAQGTAINKGDILNTMEKWANCSSRTFSAIISKGGKDVPLWPELYTMAQLLEERERLGTAIFNREMCNIYTDDTESIVKSAWLNNWEYDPAIHWSQPVSDQKVIGAVLGCDPSTGQNESGDPAGFAVVVITMGPGKRFDYWIEALHNQVMSWDGRLAQLERMYSYQNSKGTIYQIRRAYVEAVAGFIDFGNQAKAKTGLPVELVSYVKGKIPNLASKAGLFEFGKMHISNKIDKKDRDELESQLCQNSPEHDDLRDAVLLCLEESKSIPMAAWV